jgi:hypothetical protein
MSVKTLGDSVLLGSKVPYTLSVAIRPQVPGVSPSHKADGGIVDWPCKCVAVFWLVGPISGHSLRQSQSRVSGITDEYSVTDPATSLIVHGLASEGEYQRRAKSRSSFKGELLGQAERMQSGSRRQ